MLLNSPIFLLSSNSITLRRDKSTWLRTILTTLVLWLIIILILSAVTVYDNPLTLFLTRGIRIYWWLFYTIAAMNSYIFILLASSIIIFIVSFYYNEISLEDYSSFNKSIFININTQNTRTALRSGKSWLFYLIVATIPDFIFYILLIQLIESVINKILSMNNLEFCFFKKSFLLNFILITYMILLKWIEYIGNPVILFKSTSIQTSSFYTGKGKGKEKANPPSEPESPKVEANSEEDYDSDSDYHKAVKLSLQPEKHGESSKTNQSQENDFGQEKPIERETSFGQEKHSVQENHFESIVMDTQRWKFLKDVFKKTAVEHNDLKIKLTDKNKSGIDIDRSLVQLKKKADQLNLEIKTIENKLLASGIDPNEQYGYSTDSDSGSESYYSSDYKSSNSDTRPNKKIKYENPDNKFNMVLGFSTLKFGLDIVLIIRALLMLLPAVFILVELDVFPDIQIPYSNITINELLIIVSTIKLIKLVNKWKTTSIDLYNSYLNKDYFIIYTNVYISIIIILLLLSEYNDIYTFFF